MIDADIWRGLVDKIDPARTPGLLVSEFAVGAVQAMEELHFRIVALSEEVASLRKKLADAA